MVTPFDAAGRLDLDAACSLAHSLVASGSEGLVLGGSTGEGSVLTDEERLQLFEAVATSVTVPVVGSTGTNDTAHSIELTKAASSLPLAGVLVVTPYYVRPSPAGIAAHFVAVASATPLPVLCYDIPIRSGRRIGTDGILAIAERAANVVGVKDSTGDVVGAAEAIERSRGRLEWYCGDDQLALVFAAVGAVGLISVASHWAGPELASLLAAVARGDLASARATNATLFESYAFEASDAAPNPVPAKAMLRALGVSVGQCRLPHGPAPAGLEDEARSLYERLSATRA
jgi:4-hydroxy-tetrahydrodipicolinate synthase